jgi:hypothetical protein
VQDAEPPDATASHRFIKQKALDWFWSNFVSENLAQIYYIASYFINIGGYVALHKEITDNKM